MFYRNRNRNRRKENDSNEKPKGFEIHGTTGDWVGITVNIILAAFTLWAISLSKDAIKRADTANEISKNALKAAMKKDEEESVHQRTIDSLNYIRDTSTLNQMERANKISNELAKSSIQSLKDYQNRFESENYPFIEIEPLIPDMYSSTDFPYVIKNKGKIPVNIVSKYFQIYINEGDEKNVSDSLLKMLEKKSNSETLTKILSQNSAETFSMREEPILFPKELWDAIKATTFKLYYFGKLGYRVKTDNILHSYYFVFVCRFTFVGDSNKYEKRLISLISKYADDN